jgi:UTP--glucose-1-phosphate uridylyltransferase
VPDHLTHQYGICGVGKRHAHWQHVRGRRHGREAAKGHRALQPLDHRPLHPAAGDLQDPGNPGTRRRRRDPAHRRHDRACERRKRFYGVEFEGERHDCGSKAGFLRANIAYGMARADLRDGLRAEMQKYLEK